LSRIQATIKNGDGIFIAVAMFEAIGTTATTHTERIDPLTNALSCSENSFLGEAAYRDKKQNSEREVCAFSNQCWQINEI